MLEDALLGQAKQTYEAQQEIQNLRAVIEEAQMVIGAAAEDNAAYHTLLTDPDLLSDYVIEFFGMEGPFPVETPRDRLAQEVAMNEAAYAPQRSAPAPVFQRPQMEMPEPGPSAGGSSDFWDAFEQVSTYNPGALYQLLSQASPDDLRSRVLISDSPA